jgi:PTH1 family peptidyl-tRNA hydrolase
MKRGGGIAGHNGLRDISARLGSHDYWRLRIGVGHPGDRAGVIDYVLNKPSADDKSLIDDAIARSLEVMPVIVSGDMQTAMLKLHTPEKAVAKAAERARPSAVARSNAGGKPPQQEPPPNSEPAPQVDPTPTDPPPPKEDPPAEPEPAPKAGTKSDPGALKSLFNKLLPSTQK